MQGGFSFCGVDIANFGLEYVPSLDQTYVFGGSQCEVSQETFDSHHGGYFYGVTVQPKDFVLRCLYQDRHIAHGSLSVIDGFFKKGRTGRLVFDKRNWLWYVATVIDVDMKDIRNHSNGFVTITLRAYYPFARHDHISLNDQNKFDTFLCSNSGLLSNEITPTTSFQSIRSSKNILLYNGGSERAGVAISLAGNAKDGVTIKNITTGQEAKFVAFDKSLTTNVNKYIVSDSINGKTVLTNGSVSENGFLYHDHGFIELEPSFPIERDVYVIHEKDSNKLVATNLLLHKDIVGYYIYIDGSWEKVVDQDDQNIFINKRLSSSGGVSTHIVLMNQIEIQLSQGAELSKLDFLYKPTFS